ncbi:MAG: DUF4270 domain-containing protein [Bacteroidetes bacterium]|nr:DUF4270 domain-containing protein [Bacteroidota bacterium]
MIYNKRIVYSDKKNLPRIFGAKFFYFLLVIAFASCKDESSILGLDVQPEGDQLNVAIVDTTTLITYTEKLDSISSSSVPYNLLGVYNDPAFGTSKASFAIQFQYAGANPDFGTNPVLDSAVLCLTYDTAILGNLSAQHTLQVYELQQRIYANQTYYSNQNFAVNSTDLANATTFSPKPLDSIAGWWSTAKEAPHLRVKLSNTFGQNFLGNSSQMSDTAAFFNFFKGLQIKTSDNPSSGNGAVMSFFTNSSTTRIMLYYHNDTQDSLLFNLPFDAKTCARVNHFENDYSSTAILNQLSDSTLGQNLCYIQAGSGLRVRIRQPYLRNLVNTTNLAINKAELIVKLDPSFANRPPRKLNIFVADSIGQKFAMIDQEYFIGSSLTGLYLSSQKEYRFNITRHIQFLLDNPTVRDYGYVFTPQLPESTVNRVVIGGGTNANYKLKLILTFTELK